MSLSSSAATAIIERVLAQKPVSDHETMRATAAGLRERGEFLRLRRSASADQVLALADRLDDAAIAASPLA